MKPDQATTDYIRRVLSVAETGKPEWNPGAVYVYKDDNRTSPPSQQVTLSIGFTEGGGNLRRVLTRYVDNQGRDARALSGYIPGMGTLGKTLAGDSTFKTRLKTAGDDPIMAQTQKDCFDAFYLGPAFKWGDDNGFVEPMSYPVIADSYLHSGSMLGFLMNSFPEKKPAAGGNERKWINDYLAARHKWLKNHSNKVLNTTVYRAQCFMEGIAKDNWALTNALVMNGTRVNPVA